MFNDCKSGVELKLLIAFEGVTSWNTVMVLYDFPFSFAIKLIITQGIVYLQEVWLHKLKNCYQAKLLLDTISVW